MLQYLLNATAIWLVSLLLFYAFLRQENYHSYNRFYLLFTFLLGASLPLLQWMAGVSMYGTALDAATAWLQSKATWVATIYLIGALAALALLAIDILKLAAIYRTGSKSKQYGWTIVETGDEHPPFSYLNILFVSAVADYSPVEWNMIVTHERQHTLLLHLIDMILIQLARVVFWFHPLVYVYQARLVLVHEYQADHASLQPTQEYGRFLVEQAVLQAAPSIAYSFNRSPIKNRILMLTKNALPRTGLSNLKLLIVVPLTFFCLFAFIRQGYSVKPSPMVWKKQVTRMIDMREKDDTIEHHLRDVSRYTTLLEYMIKEINAGKLTAYSNCDGGLFTQKLTAKELEQQMSSKPDTVTITDPVTGKEVVKVITRDFNFDIVHKYRLKEEWTLDPNTGKTQIQIVGIAPIKEIFGENGSFRGYQAMFWLHFNEARAAITQYELYHPNNTIGSHIWDDYFTSDHSQDKHQ